MDDSDVENLGSKPTKARLVSQLEQEQLAQEDEPSDAAGGSALKRAREGEEDLAPAKRPAAEGNVTPPKVAATANEVPESQAFPITFDSDSEGDADAEDVEEEAFRGKHTSNTIV